MDGFGRAVIIGQGYVGLPVAMRAVEVGWDVIGYDVIEDKVAGLNAGQSPIVDVSDARLGDALASGRYRARTTRPTCTASTSPSSASRRP